MTAIAVEAELEGFPAQFATARTATGHAQVSRIRFQMFCVKMDNVVAKQKLCPIGELVQRMQSSAKVAPAINKGLCKLGTYRCKTLNPMGFGINLKVNRDASCEKCFSLSQPVFYPIIQEYVLPVNTHA